jgi:hypothetical protein
LLCFGVPKPLLIRQVFNRPLIRLQQINSRFLGNNNTFSNDLFAQFVVGWKSDAGVFLRGFFQPQFVHRTKQGVVEFDPVGLCEAK